jgi:hypothetical protein
MNIDDHDRLGHAVGDARKRAIEVQERQGTPTSGHALKITFDDWLNVEAICNEPKDADCRLASAGCECEEWGSIWHRVIGEGPIEPLWHQVTRSELCNVCEFLNANGDVLELAAKGARHFAIAEIPINPVWSGDGYEWEPIQ